VAVDFGFVGAGVALLCLGIFTKLLERREPPANRVWLRAVIAGIALMVIGAVLLMRDPNARVTLVEEGIARILLRATGSR
jgi:uncharacterized membrane protein HdeD (DUF308 family)